jgi:hypothetical protein
MYEKTETMVESIPSNMDVLHMLDVPDFSGNEDARKRAVSMGQAHQQKSSYRVGGIAAG